MTTRPNMESQGRKTDGTNKTVSPNDDKKKKRKLIAAKLGWDKFDSNRTRWAVLLFTALCISLFLTPGLSSKTTSYDDSWVGQISTSDIRSPGDYDVKDIDATERKKLAAAREVHPIYDFRVELGTQIQVRIDLAFTEIQSVILDYIVANVIIPEELAALENEKNGKNKAAKNKVSRNKAKPNQATAEIIQVSKEDIKKQRLKKAKDNIEKYFSQITKNKEQNKRLTTLLVDARNNFNKTLNTIIPEKNFLSLYHYHFSAELQQALKKIIADVMSNKIINDKELMEKDINGAIGIRIINTRSNKSAEYFRKDTNSILDFKEVNHSLWRYTNILSDLGRKQRELLLSLGGMIVQPNLSFNREITLDRRQTAKSAVKTMQIPIKKGEMIIRDGERFEKRHLTILKGIEQEISSTNPLAVLFGYTMLFVLIISSLVFFGYKNIRKFQINLKDMVMMSSLTIFFIFMVKSVAVVANALEPVFPNALPQVYYLAIPVAAGAAMVRIVLNSEIAMLFSFFIALLFSMLTSSPFFMAIYALITGLIAADGVGQCRARTTLFFAGLKTSLVAIVLVIFYHLLSGTLMSQEFMFAIGAAFASGIICGIVLSGMTPIIEFIFSYTTDIKLLELANLNHPLLKKLIVQSPGTYHHSIMVGSLVEAAAESIHANPLTARVAAYYHDIGKIKNPHYFAENQIRGKNPHDNLKPHMSVLILLSHVKEGVELAKHYNLGSTITSIIEQHHGTSIIRYFYNKAQEQQEQDEKATCQEQDFRYSGPKPQTKEASLVMLADSVEAATRSLEDPSPERIQGIVQKVINLIFRDEQLNECELTLKDLHQIARSFNKILVGIHHNRPSYPSAKPNQEKAQNGRSSTKSTKKAININNDMDEEDDKDIKRLGMH